MIVRFHIDQFETGRFDYRVSHEGEDLYADAGLASVDAVSYTHLTLPTSDLV